MKTLDEFFSKWALLATDQKRGPSGPSGQATAAREKAVKRQFSKNRSEIEGDFRSLDPSERNKLLFLKDFLKKLREESGANVDFLTAGASPSAGTFFLAGVKYACEKIETHLGL